MRQLLILLTLNVLTVLTSFGQLVTQPANGIVNADSPAYSKWQVPVDYKCYSYHISLGDNYQNSSKIIEWHWAALEDEDNKIDSTGKDAFLSLGEPLIHYNDGEWLPSLHITTDHNIITSFTCSVLFNLHDGRTAKEDFLKLLSKDIQQLENPEVVNALRKKGYYSFADVGSVTTIELIKGKKFEYDRFVYFVCYNE